MKDQNNWGFLAYLSLTLNLKHIAFSRVNAITEALKDKNTLEVFSFDSLKEAKDFIDKTFINSVGHCST